jgi:kynurenine formamidase
MAWYDLTQPFHADMPGSSSLPEPEVETLSTVEEDGSHVQRYAAPTHIGTHVDAPLHFVADGATIDELPPERFAGPAVVLDLDREEPGEIPLEAVEAAAEAAGGIEPGDVVLVRTGWGAHFDDEETYQRYPWLAPDVAEWLLEHEIRMVAVDTISPDRARAMRPEDWDDYPLHRALLPEGILIAEHLYLEEVADAGRDLEVMGFPLKLQDGDGAPVRFVARER